MSPIVPISMIEQKLCLATAKMYIQSSSIPAM